MALGKVFPKRLFDCFKTTSRSLSNSSKANIHREYLASPESGDKGFFRRFLEGRGLYSHSEILSLPAGTAPNGAGISVKDARKILRASQVEKLREKLRDIPHTSISYAHYFRICVQVCDHNEHQGAEFAKTFDDSGNVIVLGNVVFLRPEQVAKTMGSLISELIANPNDPRRKELESMERQKAMIDEKAKAQVRGELYCGLGFLTVQTFGLMRLTFWELSWDVMEPVCFLITSMYFTFGYIFFLRTSTEPTFQGYFHVRFKAKQQRLMKRYNFDIQRYNELCKACYPSCYTRPKSQAFSLFNHA
ncbi:Calcium uniporter protein 4 [Spatholobus suberectus]|nr:Calcium uniporter protein 4 [Spatholobus suberectus]